MRRIRSEVGQVLIFTAFFMVVLLGVAALVIDVGSWFRTHRNLQAGADAAALAGAQDLPNTSTATSTATNYAAANVTGLNSWSPTFPDSATIDVRLSKSSPEFLAHVLGIGAKTLSAHARARVGTPGSIKNALPIGVRQSIVCAASSTGCFGAAKTLTFDETTTASYGSSTWGLLDLSGSATTTTTCDGKVGESTQRDWVLNGYPGLLAVNRYYGSTTGQRTSVRNALNARIGQILLVPVFDTGNKGWCTAGGFRVVGWAAWVIDSTIPNAEWNPSVKILHGHFTEFIAHDVESVPGVPGFGVKVINLID
jgi:Putative Flp pilus-assembly TadE/G-like